MNVAARTSILSLCSGAFDGLALGIGVVRPARVVCYVEREAFCVERLVEAMQADLLDDAPVWTDLATFDGRAWRGTVDLLVAGYPCQPFSSAGLRRGADDERHLWPHVARIIDESGAPAVFLENVAEHVRVGFADVLGDLAAMGFDAEWICLPASAVGATHKRDRLFILAYRDGWRLPEQPEGDDGAEAVGRASRGGHAAGRGATLEHAGHERDERRSGPCEAQGATGKAEREAREQRSGNAACDGSEAVGDGEGVNSEGWDTPGLETEAGPATGYQQVGTTLPLHPPGPFDDEAWADVLERCPALAPVCRVADGPADRADWLRALGNGVVPLQSAVAFRILADRAGRVAVMEGGR